MHLNVGTTTTISFEKSDFMNISRMHANSYMQQWTLCIPCDLMASANAPASVWLLEVSVSDNEQNMKACELINGYKILL